MKGSVHIFFDQEIARIDNFTDIDSEVLDLQIETDSNSTIKFWNVTDFGGSYVKLQLNFTDI
jgi:hypothetical protein